MPRHGVDSSTQARLEISGTLYFSQLEFPMKFDRYEQTPSVDAFMNNNSMLHDWEVELLHGQFNINTCDVDGDNMETDDSGATPEDDSHLTFPARMLPAQRKRLRDAYRDMERMYR